MSIQDQVKELCSQHMNRMMDIEATVRSEKLSHHVRKNLVENASSDFFKEVSQAVGYDIKHM